MLKNVRQLSASQKRIKDSSDQVVKCKERDRVLRKEESKVNESYGRRTYIHNPHRLLN